MLAEESLRMELYEVMRTTFAARDFLPEAVPDKIIRTILV